MNPFVYRLANFITGRLLLPLYASIEVSGLEHVPASGPLLIASNHLNDADPGIIASRLPRPIAFMTKAELFEYPVLAQFLRAYGAFPVRRREADLGALRRAAEVLKQGTALGIFPEGTRSGAAAALQRGWPGAALLALRNDVAILPVAITGSQHMALPRLFLRPFRRYKVRVTVGEPFRLPPFERVNSQAAQEATDLIMRRIAALLPRAYQGYYGTAESSDEAALAPQAKVNDEDSTG